MSETTQFFRDVHGLCEHILEGNLALVPEIFAEIVQISPNIAVHKARNRTTSHVPPCWNIYQHTWVIKMWYMLVLQDHLERMFQQLALLVDGSIQLNRLKQAKTMMILVVGGFNSSEKYYSVGMIIPNIWKNKECSKPPTSSSNYSKTWPRSLRRYFVCA